MAFSELRKEYLKHKLEEADAAPDPFTQFGRWLDEAIAREQPQANAMTLATATADGRPSARLVLLKGWDARGFVFFTNFTSRKAMEIEANPRVTLLFAWIDMERQVRIEGRVERAGADESDEYFHSRPVGARRGAIASPQSQVIAERGVIERRIAELERAHGDAPPRPDYWGGYRVVPDLFEFWQGRESRLHDRLQYVPAAGAWRIERLAP
jgi:pyridoxamine 5'-phosphate oxidase